MTTPGEQPPTDSAPDLPPPTERRDLTLEMGVLVGVVLACAYGFTLAPTIWAGDAGELITAVYTGGVPHAPGYPLFSMVGYIATHLPLGPDPAWRLNAMTALFAWLACMGLYRIMVRRQLHPIFAGFIAMGLGAGSTFWANAVVAEVYSLNLAILAAFWLMLDTDLEKNTFRWTTWLMAGLACTAHQTSLLAAVTALVLVVGSRRKAEKTALTQKGLVGIIAPCSLYLYTLIAAQNPHALAWGHPNTFAEWLRFTLLPAGQQVSEGNFGLHLNYFFELLFGELWSQILGFTNHPSEMGLPVILALVGIGTGLAARHADNMERIWAWTAVVYVVVFMLFLHPGVASLQKLDPYYLPVWMAAWCVVPLGYRVLLESQAASPNRQYLGPMLKPILELMLALGILITGAQSAVTHNRAGDTLVRDSYTAILHNAPQESVLLGNLDDLFVCWYLQRVEGVRPDVVPVLAYLPESPQDDYWTGWIYDDLARAHPELAVDLDAEGAVQGRLIEYIERIQATRPVLMTFNDPGYTAPLYPPFDFEAMDIFWRPQQLSWRAMEVDEEFSGAALLAVANYYLRGDAGALEYDSWRQRYGDSYEQGYLLVRYLTGMTSTAQLLAEVGEYGMALELHKRTLALAPDVYEHYPMAVQMAMQVGDLSGAIAIQEQLTNMLQRDLLNGHSDIFEVYANEELTLVQLLHQAGETPRAIARLQDLLRINSDFAPAMKLLQQLTKSAATSAGEE